MKIALIHLGNLSQLIPSSSVMNGISKYPIQPEITWVVNSKNLTYIHKYNHLVKEVLSLEEFINKEAYYDILINLYPFFPYNVSCNFDFKYALGFGFDPEMDCFKKVFEEYHGFMDMNCFQLYFKLCGLSWKGEGYSIKYFPKNRCHQNRIGMLVSNINLKNYVTENLDLHNMKLWYIPYKKNMFKKMDEINKCKKIITDDITTLHLSLCLRKYVYFLSTSAHPLNIELFNSGEIYQVPHSIFG
jgi:hypothetical protein